MNPGALFILLVTAPSLVAVVLGLVPHVAHGPAMVIGGACAWALALLGALLVAWPPRSLRLAALAAAGGFLVRIGGGGMLAFAVLGSGLDDTAAIIATMVCCLGAALGIEMAWWFRALRRTLSESTVAVGNATHA